VNGINVGKSATKRSWPFALTPKSARSSLFWEKNKQNKRPEMERETLRIRERKPKNTAASQQFYCLFFLGLKVLSM
jgi:hypothetical protein